MYVYDAVLKLLQVYVKLQCRCLTIGENYPRANDGGEVQSEGEKEGDDSDEEDVWATMATVGETTRTGNSRNEITNILNPLSFPLHVLKRVKCQDCVDCRVSLSSFVLIQLKELAREELGAVLLPAREEDLTTLLVSKLANSTDTLVVSPDMEANLYTHKSHDMIVCVLRACDKHVTKGQKKL